MTRTYPSDLYTFWWTESSRGLNFFTDGRIVTVRLTNQSRGGVLSAENRGGILSAEMASLASLAEPVVRMDIT